MFAVLGERDGSVIGYWLMENTQKEPILVLSVDGRMGENQGWRSTVRLIGSI